MDLWVGVGMCTDRGYFATVGRVCFLFINSLCACALLELGTHFLVPVWYFFTQWLPGIIIIAPAQHTTTVTAVQPMTATASDTEI